MRNVLTAAALVLGLTIPPDPSSAQTYPTTTVKMLVGFSAGGTIDVTARVLADRLKNRLGQPFIVENRVGANGMVAAEAVAKAEPDGHTIFVSNSSTITINPRVYTEIRYNPERDFTPIATVVSVPLILAINADDPRTAGIRSFADFVAAAKKEPGGILYGSAGVANITHLGFELLSSRAGIQLRHVPYRGAAAAQLGILAKEVHVVFDTLAAVEQVKAGKLRALAVTSAARYPGLPDVPTVAELGFPGFDLSFWVGVFVPKKTPLAIVDLLRKEIVDVTRDPAAAKLLEAQGTIHVVSGDTLAEKIRRETKDLAEVAARSKIKIE